MDYTPEKYVSRMLELSNKKLLLLLDMVKLTQSQSKNVTEEGLDSLNQLTELKQEKINEIDKVDDEFDVYFKRLKSVLKVESLSELPSSNIKGVKELQVVIKKIMDTLNEISTIEKQNNVEAKKILSKFGDEIKKISQGKRANSAYAPGFEESPSYFIDKKK